MMMNRTRPATAKPNMYTTYGSFFIQDKTHSDKYYQKARVGSCSKIVVKNGVPMAVSFNIKDTSNRPLAYYKTAPKIKKRNKSIYQSDYCTHGEVHLAMNKKPLVPYSPNSYRNRFNMNTKVVQLRNGSQFDLGNNGLINRKQWKSTYNTHFKRPQSSYNPNPGILSDMAKRTHYQQNNIEYA